MVSLLLILSEIYTRAISVPPKRTLISREAKIAPIPQVILKLPELASFGLLLEQNVELEIAQAKRFRESPVAQHKAQKGSPREKGTGLALPVPGIGTQHMRRHPVDEDASQVIRHE